MMPDATLPQHPFPEPCRHHVRLGLAAVAMVILAAIAWRAPLLVRESLWYDELLTVDVVVADDVAAMLRNVVTIESSPPLFFAAAHAVVRVGVFGDASEEGATARKLAIRWVSLCSAAAAAMIAAGLVMRFAPTPAAIVPLALLAAIATLLQPFLFWYSVEGRPYALLTAWLMAYAATVAMMTLPERRDARMTLAMPVFAAGAIATHYFAVLPVVVGSLLLLTLHLTADRATRPPLGRVWWLGHAALGCYTACWGLLMIEQSRQGHTSYIPPTQIADLARTFLIVFPLGLDAALPAPMRVMAAAGVVMAGLADVTILWHDLHYRRLSPTGSLALTGLVLWIMPVVCLFALSFLRPIFIYDRYPIIGLPGMLLVVLSLGVRTLDVAAPRPNRAMAATALALMLFLGGWQCARYTWWPSEGGLRERFDLLLPTIIEAAADAPEDALWVIPDPVLARPLAEISPMIRQRLTARESALTGVPVIVLGEAVMVEEILEASTGMDASEREFVITPIDPGRAIGYIRAPIDSAIVGQRDGP